MSRRLWPFVLGALLASVLVAAFVAPFASKSPDGFERVAQDKGFAEKGERAPAWHFALIPDYVVRGIGNEKVANALAGLAGTLLVFGVAFGAAKLMARKPKARQDAGGPQ